MPSDAPVAGALQVLAATLDHYRSAVATTLDEVSGALAAHVSGRDGRAARLQVELGPFAAGRIDTAKLARVLGDDVALDPGAEHYLQRALDALRAVSAGGDALFRVDVEPMGDVTGAVTARLAEAGRAFAAARVATLVLGHQGLPGADLDRALDGFGFARWSTAERRLAPPLVVTVAGSDLRVSGLADVLDGAMKIVIAVGGDCAPAPLARLITPQTLVVQTGDLEGLTPLASWSGPAVAALVPASAARFIHHPAGGAETWRRMTVHHVPAAPTRAIGGLSAAQQAEDLRQLAAMATPPAPAVGEVVAAAGATAAPAVAPAVDPVDRLAAWLLRQADAAAPR